MNAPAERLVSDVKVLAADVEELLRASAAQTGDKVAAARARVQAALAESKDTVALQARQAAEVADRFVHENPWKSVGVTAGISAGIGLLVGILIGRR